MSGFISNLSRLDKGIFNQDKFVRLVCYECRFHIEEYSRDWFDILGIGFPPSLSIAVVKRQAEYLAGRFTAKTALSELGIYQKDITIGKNRYPNWPESVVASITHSDNKALCVVAEKTCFRCIGVDFEVWVSCSETYIALEEMVINSREKELLQKGTLEMQKAVVTVFSAKESLFKAIYPYVCEYFDFSAAVVTKLCERSQSFELTLTETLSNEFVFGQKIIGKFEFDSSGVKTLVAF